MITSMSVNPESSGRRFRRLRIHSFIYASIDLRRLQICGDAMTCVLEMIGTISGLPEERFQCFDVDQLSLPQVLDRIVAGLREPGVTVSSHA
jgi:hypothetical protein